jgi:hypothetical protein
MEPSPPFAPDARASIEIAFGRARTELSSALARGQSQAIPISGSAIGDEIWLRFGEAELRFALDRAAGTLRAKVEGRETTLAWDTAQRAVTTSDGQLVDVAAFVREAIDATLKAPPPPPSKE